MLEAPGRFFAPDLLPLEAGHGVIDPVERLVHIRLGVCRAQSVVPGHQRPVVVEVHSAAGGRTDEPARGRSVFSQGLLKTRDGPGGAKMQAETSAEPLRPCREPAPREYLVEARVEPVRNGT